MTYVITKNQSDFPGHVIMRRWLAIRGQLVAEQVGGIYPTIEAARADIKIPAWRVPLLTNDDPVIQEA